MYGVGLLCLQSPYQCNLLIAGYDEGAGASLYWLDYLATLHKVNTGGTGYGEHHTATAAVALSLHHYLLAAVWQCLFARQGRAVACFLTAYVP